MPTFKAKQVPQKIVSAEDILCRFCYHFPQYTYIQARELPYKRVKKMLEIAKKEQAQLMIYLTHIVTAPHTKKGAGVKKLLNSFKEIIEGD